jgi:hypothetical protein
MSTLDVIHRAMSTRGEPRLDARSGEPTAAWWASLVDDLRASAAELLRTKHLAQFSARYNGCAVIVDAEGGGRGGQVASFELRIDRDGKLSCASLNEVAERDLAEARRIG